MSASQSREEIGAKLDSVRPNHSTGNTYRDLLLELILDVLVDIRDSAEKSDNDQ